MSEAGRRLLGVETEYSFSALDADGHSLARDTALGSLLWLARARLPSIPAAHSGGLFLANASRLYVDAGPHLELSTPECTTPWDGVRYVLAGDRILERLADELVAADQKIAELVLTRCNVDYSGSGSTWGCHESYLYRGDPEILAREIIPHFVSRVVMTGAGGFDNRSSGLKFLLSPRVRHLVVERSATSTCERGIFHTKDEALCGGGFRRLHVLCGESSCSNLAAWLKLGTTALVVALIEARLRPAGSVYLTSAVEAMHRFAGDPDCRLEAASLSGTPLSAISIQRHYLEQAEAHLGESFMPPWAEEVCRVWRATLDELEKGSSLVTTRLDWAIKLALFRRRAERRGFEWGSLTNWTYVADRLVEAVAASSHPRPDITAEEVLSKTRSPVPDAVERLTPFLERSGLRWDGLRPFLDLKKELFEIDTRFSQLGARGIFRALDRAGALAHDAPGVDDIEGAVEAPPSASRAQVRGEAIRALAKRRGTCAAEWDGVWDGRRKRVLDLRDPFAETALWQSWDQSSCPAGRLPSPF